MEMLVVIMVLPFVFLIVDGLFRTLLTDIPRSYRVAQENTILLNMLEQVRQDVDKARGLPESFAGLMANDEVLLIEQADGVISYQMREGRAVRQRLTIARQNDAEQTRTWSLPHAKVSWRVWTRDGERYAVEASTHVEQWVGGQWKEKMANSHLYFPGTL